MEELLTKYSKIPRAQRFAGIGVLIVAMVLGYFFLVYRDQATHLVTREAKYTKLEKERLEKQAYIDNLAKYQARLNELQDELDSARAKLPDASEVPQLLAQLANKGRQAGLNIVKFEPKKNSRQKFFEELNFAVTIRGSFHEIASFVDAVGKLERIVNVNSITMKQPTTKNKKILLESDVNIRTFRFMDGGKKKKKKKRKGKKR